MLLLVAFLRFLSNILDKNKEILKNWNTENANKNEAITGLEGCLH